MQKDYKFPISFNITKTLPIDKKTPTVLTPDAQHIHDNTFLTPSEEGHTWHDMLDILIPNDLLLYVTDKPIYVSKRQKQIKGKTHASESK
jgi:hypothetical protein